MTQLHSDNLKNDGFAVLIGVLIVGAFGAAVVLYLITAGLYSYQDSFILEQSNIARYTADACTEVALNKIQMCSSTVGLGSVNIGENSCSYEIINTGEQTRTIQSSAQIGTIIRKEKIIVNQVAPNITINSWQEVSSF